MTMNTSNSPRRRRSPRSAGAAGRMGAIALLGAAALSLASCGSDKGQQQMQQGAPQIATITVEPATSSLDRSYAATIKGKTDVEVRPMVSGFITAVNVDEGQRVRKGQTLFTLDQVQPQAAVDQAQAAVNSARTAVETARLTANNKQKLFDKGIISEYENQVARNQLAQAQASLAQAQANLATARKNLAYTVVTAPSDGVVGSIPNRAGSLASPSMQQPLTTLSDNSDVYAYFSLNEKDILDMTRNGTRRLNDVIKEMPPVRLQLADGTLYPEEGRVATVSGVIDQSTGSANVRARFPNASGMLRSGSTGRVLIPNQLDSVIIIPQKATYEIQDRKFVYVVNDSNKTVGTAIGIDALNDGHSYIVTSGLAPGQRIVVEGVGTSVRDGMAIQPVEAGQQPQQPQQPQAQQPQQPKQ